MARKNTGYGLLIDYEYCTGCHACEIACAQEYDWPAGMGGMRVTEMIQPLPNDKAYLAYLPFPTELCIMCAGRVAKGQKPACVQTCMSACMKHGRVEDLAKEINKPRMALFVPK